MRTRLFLLLFILLPIAASAQEYITFRKKRNPKRTFSFPLNESSVLLKMKGSGLQISSAMISGYAGSTLSLKVPGRVSEEKRKSMQGIVMDRNLAANDRMTLYYTLLFDSSTTVNTAAVKYLKIGRASSKEQTNYMKHMTWGSFALLGVSLGLSLTAIKTDTEVPYKVPGKVYLSLGCSTAALAMIFSASSKKLRMKRWGPKLD